MTIDLTLNDIMIPALPYFTPRFGTKKASGGLTTEEVNNNILAYFSRRRPIIVIENSDTSQVEYDANLLLNTAGLTLELGAGTYVGCTVTVTFPVGGSLKYTSKIGTVTDTLRATACVSYIWKGTWWEAIIGKCAIDDVLFQLPDVPNPGLMYGGQWEEHPYAGMFFRSQGGNAKAFTTPIAGSFTSSTVFTASAALPSSVAAGDLVIVKNEYRTISSISGQNITIDSAFSNYSNITNLLSGSLESLPNIAGQFIIRPSLVGGADYNTITSAAPPFSTRRQSGSQSPISLQDGDYDDQIISFDASRSNPIYGRGAHVQPNTVTCRTWLRIA